MAAQTQLQAKDPEPGAFETLLGSIGRSFLDIAGTAGGMTILLGRILSRFFPPRLDQREVWKNMYKMAVKSLPIVAVTALFTGAIMVIQAATIVKRYGAEGLLGGGGGGGGSCGGVRAPPPPPRS